MWYKDAIIYQLHVKVFYDANGDGIGDFQGLTSKLDYLQALGVTAIWLLPFYPSPLRDDGYDIADYYNIHPSYGTMDDFKRFLREAHRRGLRVITELVINHTSDQHPWFQRARRAKPGSVARDYYVWSPTQDKYKDVRIIFKDFETSNWEWDEEAKMYYWHRFYSHQPDLNFDNPKVKEEIFHVMDFWLKMGVDGLRLDAIPYLYEREGTNGENLPESHAFLQELRARVDRIYPDRMLLAEANQWPEDVTAYFSTGNECHMAFHFPLMPRLYMALQMEDAFPIVNILEQTPKIPDGCQWAIFLRNHDELTLEMVTDEEREYMYHAYAKDKRGRINLGIRRRLAPLLENDRRKIELLHILLLTLSGTPILYYGDEIGMGDNFFLGDRNGCRTPMQWSSSSNAGFSHADPQQLYFPVITSPLYHYTFVNVEMQEQNRSSLLAWVMTVLAVRKQSTVFGRGTISFLSPDNPKILAFIRSDGEERVAVVVNLSQHAQTVDLDLSRWQGVIPEDIFSRNRFSPIEDAPYRMTLGGYGYYLLNISDPKKSVIAQGVIPEIGTVDQWEDITQGNARQKLTEHLSVYLQKCRWFAGKGRHIRTVKIVEQIPIGNKLSTTWLTLVEVHYTDGPSDAYQIPLSFAMSDAADKIRADTCNTIICRIRIKETCGIIYDGVYDQSFQKNLLHLIEKQGQINGEIGALSATHGEPFQRKAVDTIYESKILNAEQSNSSILYGNQFILKLYRKVEEGMNPDLEIGRYLQQYSDQYAPLYAGAIAYRSGKLPSEPMTIGLLQRFIPNQGDGWGYMLDAAKRYMEHMQAFWKAIPDPLSSPLRMTYEAIWHIAQERNEQIIERVSLLGKRTAELHIALSRDTKNPDFAPEPFSTLYQRSLYQSFQSNTKRKFHLLKQNIKNLPEGLQKNARDLLAIEDECYKCYRPLLDRKISAMRIRIHGDYHLGQVLFTGDDFVVIDFEGEPARPLYERRLKRSPLRDVAGMLRSFHYVISAGLLHDTNASVERSILQSWADFWYTYLSDAFLRSYLDTVAKTPLLPENPIDLESLLNAFLLERALYELWYEINHRPDWVQIPIQGILSILSINERAP